MCCHTFPTLPKLLIWMERLFRAWLSLFQFDSLTMLSVVTWEHKLLHTFWLVRVGDEEKPLERLLDWDFLWKKRSVNETRYCLFSTFLLFDFLKIFFSIGPNEKSLKAASLMLVGLHRIRWYSVRVKVLQILKATKSSNANISYINVCSLSCMTHMHMTRSKQSDQALTF